jgi:frataxin-like iron-binding protein CyaY
VSNERRLEIDRAIKQAQKDGYDDWDSDGAPAVTDAAVAAARALALAADVPPDHVWSGSRNGGIVFRWDNEPWRQWEIAGTGETLTIYGAYFKLLRTVQL